MKKMLIFYLTFISLSSFSQHLKRAELSILENGAIIQNPFTGGLSSSQLSNIDFNNDGINDVFVFERIGDRTLALIKNSNGSDLNYTYSKEYSSSFPKLEKWALLLDFNCDGKEDIFTYNDSYVRVYKNTSDDNSLSFEVETNALISDLGPIQSAIIISEVDIPSFVDVDFDGDIDVLTFKQSGGYVEYHQNQSQELYGNCDSLIFELKTDCWGKFFEGLNEYDFNSCQSQTTIDQPIIESRSSGGHSGSSTLTLDIDGDNDMDIILGDVSFNNLNLLINTGDSEDALMTSVNQDFPNGNGSNVSAEIESFPAAFHLDVNNDGIRDLVVSPNTNNNAEDFESIYLFLNSGTDNAPVFEFEKTNFLQELILDFGTAAYPSMIDYNNDGLKDLIIGNYGYHAGNNPSSQLALLRNIGSETEPNFELIDRDFGNLSAINLDTSLVTSVAGLTPTFGDLDNDGDVDLIVGDGTGKIHYFKNTAAIGSDAQFELENVNFFSIDIGQHSAPFLFDMNEDGLLDLVIGRVDGSITYAQNNGTETNPVFNSLLEDFGDISVNNDESLYGFSIPFVFVEDGEIQMLIGSESGQIYHYNNISGNLSGTFNLLSDNFQNTQEGKNVACLYEDFTGDGRRDMFFGMQSGGLFYYINDSTVSSNTTYGLSNVIDIYPNPSNDIINIKSEEDAIAKIYSIHGQLLINKRVSNNSQIDISHLQPAYYFISFKTLDNSKIIWKKIIVQ